MENTQPKTGKFIWTYGSLLGVAGIAFGVILFSMDMHYEQGWDVRIIGTLLLIVGIVLATYQYKKANGGFLVLSDALKLGAGIGLVGALFSLIWYAVLVNVIEPDFMDKAMEIAKVKTFEENPKLTEEQWQQGMEMQKSFAWVTYPIVIVINIIIGLVIGLITGLIMKKQKPAY
ncbi:MAG TPA: DUF4199 domain-containing protein [Pricia antarctica]|uniref:DUF4199 domain-containing protein n=1 Tax=Pricia antarctica TaxID=641691 RepID=A0A831VPU0_9FLAO|nr:DUF4199 domain-containing protein [Pricia antarctica]